KRLTLGYDDQHRLVTIADAIGQVTAISYESPDPLKITKVTDPFGRSATFEYNASNQLARITDVINLASSFTYGPGDFINRVSTPSGDTTCAVMDLAGNRHWIEAPDANGDTEHMEFRHNAPGIPGSEPSRTVPAGFDNNNTFLEFRNTFFWDKRNWR